MGQGVLAYLNQVARVRLAPLACSAPQDTTPKTSPDVASTTPSVVAPVVAIEPVSPPASAAPSQTPPAASSPSPSAEETGAKLPEYPMEWIREAEVENLGRSCLELVYRHGCQETRTGTATLRVTLDEDGKVIDFVETENKIRHEKAVVSRCLARNLPHWKFHRPEGHRNSVEVTVRLADRC